MGLLADGRGRGRWQRWLKLQYVKLVRINDTPVKVALGMGVGVFLGIFPTFGLGMVLAFLLAWIFRFNKASAVIGSTIMNPLTTPFFWSLSCILGAVIVGGDWREILNQVKLAADTISWSNILHQETWALLGKLLGKGLYVYLAGNILLSLGLAIVFYFLTFYGLGLYKKRKAARNAPQEP